MIQSRRLFLARITGAGIAVPALMTGCGRHPASGIQYLDSLRGIIRTIASDESASIAEAADRAAWSLLRRSTVFVSSGGPDFPGFFPDDNPGMPPVFVQLRSLEMAGAITENDSVIAFGDGDTVRMARERGASVIMVDMPRPRGIGNRAGDTVSAPGDADIVISSHVPENWRIPANGGASPTWIPEVYPVAFALTLALAGEIYQRSGGIGRTGNSRPGAAQAFLELLDGRIAEAMEQRDEILEAAGLIGVADRLPAGGRVLLYDRPGAFGRAVRYCGAPPQVLPASRGAVTGGELKPNDTLVIGALSSNSPSDLTLVRAARQHTQRIVGICPHDENGGWRLFKDTNAALDNLSPETEGVLSFDDDRRRFLATGNLMNTVLMWAAVVESVR